MKACSTALAAHIAQEVTTCAWLVQLERADGYVYGMTDHDYSILFTGSLSTSIVTVNGTDMPWNGADTFYGYHIVTPGTTGPLIACVPGAVVTVQYISGTIFCQTASTGPIDASGGPGNTDGGIYPWPSDHYGIPSNAGELAGAFIGSGGVLGVFRCRNYAVTAPAPAGTQFVSLGVNTYENWAVNSGSWRIGVAIGAVPTVYWADVSYGKFNVNDRGNLDESTTQIDIPIDGNIFVRDDFLSRKWDYATVRIQLVNWADLSQGAIIIATGSLGSFAVQDNVASADYRGLSYALRQLGGDLCQPECRVDFGSPIDDVGGGCGINITLKTQTGIVVTTDGGAVIIASGLADNGDQYAGGLITFLSGNNQNLSYEYRTAVFTTATGVVSTYIQLELNTLMPIGVGDTFAFVPGCDKTITQCKAYGNDVNFQGEPYAPQPDAAQSYPDYKAPKNA